MEIQDWRTLRNLLSIFGIILLAAGIYIASSAGPVGLDTSWATARALKLADDGWDIALLVVGACLISASAIFHFRLREEESVS